MTGSRLPGTPRILVAPDQAGRTLISFLKRYLPRLPLSGIHKMLRTGRIRVNGARARPGQVLAAGDEITLQMAPDDFLNARYRAASPEPGAAARHRSTSGTATASPSLRVLAETEHWIAVAKPAGLLTHAGDPAAFGGTSRPGDDTLVARVLAHEAASGRSATFPPVPVHRLDRGTSGVVLFARTAAGARRLAAAFRDGTARKEYLAVVQGRAEEGTLDMPLVRDERARVSRVHAGGGAGRGRREPAGPRPARAGLRTARTDVRVLARSEGASLVLAEPRSGRTHQIRAHLASAGTPLLGDVKYGGRPLPGRPGFLLHAWRLSLPGVGDFTCPLPDDWHAVLAALALPLPRDATP